MPSPEALYNSVKSGQVQLTDLNDDGKNALRSYMDNLPSQSTPSDGVQRYGIDVLHPENSPMKQQINQDNSQQPVGPPAPPQSFADQAQSLNADDANGNRRTDFPGGIFNPVNDLNSLYNAPLIRELTHGSGQAMGLQDNQMSANKSTGSGLVDSVANIIGQGVGYMTNPSQLENSVGQNFFGNQTLQDLGSKAGSLVESKLPQNAFGRMAGNAAEQGVVGALGSAAYAPFNTLINGQDVQDIPKNMLEQGAIGGALGGGLGALGSAAKSGLSALGEKYAGTKLGDMLNSFFNKAETPQAAQDQGQLALPPASDATIAEYNRRNGNVLPTNIEPIYGQGDIYKPEPIGLPEPQLSSPTTARLGAPVNGSKGLYEQLSNEVNSRIASGDIKPVDTQGYANLQASIHDGFKNGEISPVEYHQMQDLASQELQKQRDIFNQHVQNTYSQIAPKEAPPLEKLMTEAYQNKKPISSDLVQRAKYQQSLRNAAGVDLPVKSIDQRYTEANNGNRLGVTGRAASPETKIGFTKQSLSDAKVEPITAKEKVLNADVQPSKLNDAKAQDAIIQTKEPRIRDKIYNVLDQAEQAARERLAAKRNTLSSLPLDQYRDYSIIGAAKLGKGTIKFADWSEAMVKDFGQEIKPHLKDIYTMSKNQVKEAEKNVVNKEKFNKVEANPTLPDTSSQIQSKTIKEKTSLGQKFNQAYINTVDNVHRLNQFDKAAKDANKGELKPSDSAYKLALNSRNADMQARQILEHNMIDKQGNTVGNSLMKVAKQIPAKDLKAFEDYQVAKHAITRMGRGEKVYNDNLNMTIQKAKMIVENYDKTNPEFAKVNQDYQSFDHQLGQHWLVDTGLLTQKQWDQYRLDNPNYTPNNRIFTDLEKNSKFGSKGGFADQSKPIKQAEGSQRQIVSPLESRIEHVATYVKTARQNEVFQAIFRSLGKNPEALKGFAENAHGDPHVDVNEMLQKDGPEGLMNHIAQTIESAKQKPDLTKGNIVSGLVNGEVKHLRIFDPQFLEAVGNLSPEAQPKWIEAVGKVTKVMKTTTTGVNPIFGLTKNIWKDIPHAYISSKTTNPFNPMDTVRWFRDLVSALVDVTGNKEAYQNYKNMGGGHSSSLSADRNLLAQSKEKLVPSTGIGQTLKRNLITKPYHKLENFNNAIETAPRLAEYKRVVKQGGGTYDSKVEGLHQANDLTTNFNKRGNYVKQLDSLVPYLNASVQGLDQLYRMAFKGGAKQFASVATKAVMAISLPQAILYAVNHNDHNYQQLSNYTKDNNFCIPLGDGTFLKIPKPREMGMLFGSLLERGLRQWNDHDPKAFQDYSNNLIQNFAPPGIGGAISGAQNSGPLGAGVGVVKDSIAGPLVNLGLNKDFANRPIVPKDLAGLSPSLQVDAKTSEPAKFIGNLTNTSPKQLDYLAKSYLGGVASLGVPATTKGGSLLGTLKQQVTADPLYSNDIGSNFYNEKAKQDQAKADSKATGIPPQRDLSGYYDKLASTMTPLRKAEKAIQNDNSLSNSEKQAKLRAIQAQMNSILQRGLIK